MIYPILIFILFLASHYFAGYLLYNSFLLFNQKKYLAYLIPSSITLLFAVMLIAINYTNSQIFNYLYILSAVLFGLLTQLILFGIIFFLFKYTLPKQKYLAKIFFIIATLFFFLGLYNAFFPYVKTIDLDNFRNGEASMRLIHLSDTHLGLIYQPYYLENLVKKVNNLDADIIVISGDLFDGNDSDLNKFSVALEKFSLPVIFVPGNHDQYLEVENISRVVNQAGLIELKDEAYSFKDFEFIGFNYIEDYNSNLRRDIKNIEAEKSKSRIVINHEPIGLEEAEALKADLMISGHTHRGQIFPFNLVTYVVYGKHYYGLSQYKDMITYTSAGVGTWGPPFRTLFPGEIIVFNINNN
jgi:predicted MPP superfamily phosphohydrolase